MFHTRPHLPTYPQNRAHNKGGSETRKAIDHYSYAINDEIGRGFSSRVYKGRDENTLEPVAVKVIDMKMVKQSIHAQLLKNEINALKAFNSKNIMKLCDVFQTQNNTYIITEFCDSGDLNNHIKKKGRIDENEAIRILQSVVSAVNEMNQKGYIHRDIKPANILIDKNLPKLADFGFAVPAHEARLQGKNFNVGTPLYMSPQALRQQGHTEKGDVWAIGVVFFEMLYGRTPYNASSEAALISNIMHQSLVIPSSPPVSDKAKDFIRKCLSVDENKRLRVKDMVHHEIIEQRALTPVERAPARKPFEEISNLNIPTEPSQIQKFKRSQSQGVKEAPAKEYKTQQIEDKKKQHEAKQKKLQEQIQRSSSQQQALQPQKITKTSAFEEQPPVQKQKTISLEFKSNNEILIQIFTKSLLVAKIFSIEIRDKLLFLMGKNIAIKINKLATILDKENKQVNIFQLDDFEGYKKSESHSKFSQAISEYNDKYMRHFEKILKLASKNEFQKDQLIGNLCNNDITENESFYKVALQYLKQSINEIKQNFKSISGQKDQLLPEELQMPSFILFGLYGYQQLISKTLENWSDYKQFQKASSPELLIERKPGQMNYGLLEQLL
ncbi:unnamed protein product (macronuclear) [Paramecium tetraurelia]|uniref:Protein kinase domain-containing protein n=1 Tax=Paramecium tetraurelia TaxID=5888 RepID=A0DW27_PARTE|nr:uncharacterized protein GSPATT00020897001 [Paramecium tetraurelia]CAK87244.1 unnamed protein product [Paramecium tetraurelia]|eukprot:XP_001454641.1 hypothetical protein (macronuclear) [Paramecium tetraurelia strain d4-2]